jgi:hypothetical protein
MWSRVHPVYSLGDGLHVTRYHDLRSDYQTNEPALDYNAAFTGLTARYAVVRQ